MIQSIVPVSVRYWKAWAGRPRGTVKGPINATTVRQDSGRNVHRRARRPSLPGSIPTSVVPATADSVQPSTPCTPGRRSTRTSSPRSPEASPLMSSRIFGFGRIVAEEQEHRPVS